MVLPGSRGPLGRHVAHRGHGWRDVGTAAPAAHGSPPMTEGPRSAGERARTYHLASACVHTGCPRVREAGPAVTGGWAVSGDGPVGRGGGRADRRAALRTLGPRPDRAAARAQSRPFVEHLDGLLGVERGLWAVVAGLAGSCGLPPPPVAPTRAAHDDTRWSVRSGRAG